MLWPVISEHRGRQTLSEHLAIDEASRAIGFVGLSAMLIAMYKQSFGALVFEQIVV